MMKKMFPELKKKRYKYALFGSVLAMFAVASAFADEAALIEADPPGFEVISTQNPEHAPHTPEEALEMMTFAEGFNVTLFAAEPHLRQPIAFTFDSRGRVWVVENYSYPELEVKNSDRVLIFEDTTGDGRFDRRRIFWDEGTNLTGIELGFGGVWLTSAPELIFIPLDDEGDAPAGEPVVLLDGFNDGSVGHNIVNGLLWGPDGWLYGRHGIQATSYVGKPGTPHDDRRAINCSIWRFHPTRHVFEVVTEGTTNPWGLDYNDYGEMFFTNNVNGHLFHAVPGSHFIRMYGQHFNRHLYGLMGVSADHKHWAGNDWTQARFREGEETEHSRLGGGHSHCGGMIYLGNNWPEEYRDRIFMLNVHGKRINQDILERNGSGYVARHGEDLLFANDPWFRGIELKYGPDGGVFFTDWTQYGECHDHDGIHRHSGRMYKMVYGEPEPLEPFDVYALDNEALVELQLHENDWFVRQSRRILQERAVEGDEMEAVHASLRDIFGSHEEVPRKLRALWSLHVTGGASEAWLAEQLSHDNEHVRVWAVRLLTEEGAPSDSVIERFAEMAAEDSSFVRLYIASALQRLPVNQRWEIAEALLRDSANADDRNLWLMTWYGVEALGAADFERATDLIVRCGIRQIQEFMARRIAFEATDDTKPLVPLVRLLGQTEDDSLRREVLYGVAQALRGRSDLGVPEGWDAAYPLLLAASDSEVAGRARELASVFGDVEAVEALRRAVGDVTMAPSIRREALRTLVDQRAEGVAPLLHELLEEPAMREQALRGLAAYSNEDTPERILSYYHQLDAQEKSAALDTLISRIEYARPLLDAVESGRIPSRDISAYQALQLRNMGDETINAKLEQTWGAILPTSEEKRSEIASYEERLTPDVLSEADLTVGKRLFEQRCAQCHTLFGEGGELGPDLSGSGRDNLFYLLHNIIDPNASISEDYRITIVTTTDNRVLAGNLSELGDRSVAVQTAGERVVLDRSQIEKTEPLPVSMMPEGLLNGLTDEEVRDLIAYLQTN